MTSPINALIPIVNAVQESARILVDQLAASGHPDTSRATAIFQDLIALQGWLFNEEYPPTPADLEWWLRDLMTRSTGALSVLQPALRRAAETASGAQGG